MADGTRTRGEHVKVSLLTRPCPIVECGGSSTCRHAVLDAAIEANRRNPSGTQRALREAMKNTKVL